MPRSRYSAKFYGWVLGRIKKTLLSDWFSEWKTNKFIEELKVMPKIGFLNSAGR